MRNQFTQLSIVILFAVFFMACKKDTASGSTDNLTSKTWRPSLTDKNPATNPSGRIIYYAVLNCEKDDAYQFSTSGTLTINNGTDKCNTIEPATRSVSYSYNADTKELIIEGRKYSLAETSGNQVKYYAPLNAATGYDYIVYLFE